MGEGHPLVAGCTKVSLKLSVLVKDAPSRISTFLCRRNFASYDKALAQISTTHGGRSRLGDWSLKRPLPMKVCKARLHIAIGSLQQRTECTPKSSERHVVANVSCLGFHNASVSYLINRSVDIKDIAPVTV